MQFGDSKSIAVVFGTVEDDVVEEKEAEACGSGAVMLVDDEFKIRDGDGCHDV